MREGAVDRVAQENDELDSRMVVPYPFHRRPPIDIDRSARASDERSPLEFNVFVQEIVIDWPRKALFIVKKVTVRVIDHVRFFAMGHGDIGMLVEVIVQGARPSFLGACDDEVQPLNPALFWSKHEFYSLRNSAQLGRKKQEGSPSLRFRPAYCNCFLVAVERNIWQQSAMRVLVIEDDARLARQITRELQRYNHESSARNDGAEGLQAALVDPPDLIVLDINLPGLDGLSVLARLRAAHSTARILILTARGEVGDRVKGLKAGADDYLGKPFSMNELIARVEALGRRAASPTAADLLKVGNLQMDVQHRHVFRAGQAIALSPREFDVLQVLMQEPGRVFSRTELCERIWQREHEYDTRTVEIFITRLRKKIDSEFEEPLIQTLRYVGYCIRSPRTA